MKKYFKWLIFKGVNRLFYDILLLDLEAWDMSKISNVILMLDYLNTGNKYTAHELSQKLGVTERMVKYYKKELENAGIFIDTFMGPNGGYFLLKNSNFYNQFNKYDLQLLESIYSKLENTNFRNLDKFNVLIEKIKKVYEIEEEKSKYIDEIDESDKDELIFLIEKYISDNSRLKIVYEDISGERKERWIHPLHIFKYGDKVFVTAFCELRNDIRHFEIERIKLIKEKQ